MKKILLILVMVVSLNACSSINKKDYGYNDLVKNSSNTFQATFEEIDDEVDRILKEDDSLYATYFYRDYNFIGAGAGFKIEDVDDYYRSLGEVFNGEFLVHITNNKVNNYKVSSINIEGLYLKYDKSNKSNKNHVRIKISKLTGSLYNEIKTNTEAHEEIVDNELARYNLPIEKQLELINQN
jgi:hypothetical protein